MIKNKITIGIITFLAAGALMTKPALAITPQVSIQQLPSYMNTDSFKLSCSAMTDALIDGDSGTTSTAQFYFEKNGGGYSAFGPSIDLSNTSCQVQVTGTQISGEDKYNFKVSIDGVEASTSTIYDHSGPSTVSDYHKEQLNDGFKIFWKNPSDSDFSKVIIYRGEVSDFSADSSHEVTTQPGGGGSPMTYEDHFGADFSKTYYYILRAVDKAGNSSEIVGDTVTITTQVPPSPESGQVTIFPKEAGQGSILGAEATPTSTPTITPEPNLIEKVNGFASTTPQPFKWILTHKKISIGIALVLTGIIYGAVQVIKKRK